MFDVAYVCVEGVGLFVEGESFDVVAGLVGTVCCDFGVECLALGVSYSFVEVGGGGVPVLGLSPVF